MNTAERAYSYVYKNILKAINPIKKKIIKTECTVHKAINNQSLKILRNDGYEDAYNFISNYIVDINRGAVWADQDLKSSNHFYNPYTKRGLYGNSNAKKECISYYTQALNEYFNGDIKDAFFYLGAACHLIQDLTVPHHANVRLLDNHRSFENWVIKMYKIHDEFKLSKGGIYLNSLKFYIDYNSKKSLKIYEKYHNIKDQKKQFYNISAISLIIAQKTTAGVMYKFYYDIQKLQPIFSLKGKLKKF